MEREISTRAFVEVSPAKNVKFNIKLEEGFGEDLLQENNPNAYSPNLAGKEPLGLTKSRKRFESIYPTSYTEEHDFSENADQENRHPNQYSLPKEDNPLTHNQQNYPSKPVKTAGCYIPRKKKAAIPTCILNKDEMTP